MYTTVLVPLDGSERAETALPVARRIARNTGATLVLVRVVSFLAEYWPVLTSAQPSLMQGVVERDLQEATDYLRQAAAAPEMAGIAVKTTVQFGQPAPTILTVAVSYNTDLMVLCSHGSAGMVHWMMGSVADKIARHATMPVLIVREGSVHLDGPETRLAQPLRVLVPLDGSQGSQAALEPGAELLQALAATGQKTALHLTRVCQPSQANEPGGKENELARARGSLQQMTRQIREGQIAPTISESHVPVTWSVVFDQDVARALLRVAEQGDDTEGAGPFGGCDLIAISTHGRSGFQRWALGSITERLLHATRHPLLIVHPPRPADWHELVPTGEGHSLRTFLHQ